MTAPSSAHWLEEVAGHAGLRLELPQRPDITDIRETWPRVADACGLDDDRFADRVAGHFRTKVADVEAYEPQAIKLIPEAVARRYGILPLEATESTIVIATSDPTNRSAINEIVALANRQPSFLIASPPAISAAIERAYAPARAPKNALQTLVAQVAETDFQVVSNQGRGLFTAFELEDPAVVKLSDVILQQGVRYRATEIHIEPAPTQGRIRYRIDGVLQHVVDLPMTAHARLVARLRHLAFEQPGVDADEGFPIAAPGGETRQAHLLSSPTPDGDLIWIRLADPDHVPTLETLNFRGAEAKTIHQALARTDGLMLVTGPARSGTTNFIYAALNAMSDRSVLSLESRPELVVPGVTQVRYDPMTGTSFAAALQDLLDRNPDVIHAGELRDLATARIALRSAVTGRKVLATTHTGDAVSGLRRLIDLGLAATRLAESLDVVISLRLVRKLCDHCARDFEEEEDGKSREAQLARVLGVLPRRRAIGCKECAGTGYQGQLPLPEVLVMTDELREFLHTEPTDAELTRAAQASGMRTFSEVGLERVREGDTTIEELERVLNIVPTREETPSSIGSILVVDDDEDERLLITTILEDIGFHVVPAGGGAEAEALLRRHDREFSLALVDLLMPEMDGLTLLSSIRSTLSTHSLPVVVVTSSSDPGDELRLLEAGADDYVMKPVSKERLDARVRAVLRRAGVHLEVRSTEHDGASHTGEEAADPE